MTEFKMLGEFIHYCTKCKLELNHRIILMGDTAPKRILCLTCNSERAYRAAPPSSATAKRAKKAPSSVKTDSTAEWRAKLADKSKTPKPYPAAEDTFATDDLIYHKSFGLGLVVHLIPPDKMHIFFDDGLKVMKRVF